MLIRSKEGNAQTYTPVEPAGRLKLPELKECSRGDSEVSFLPGMYPFRSTFNSASSCSKLVVALTCEAQECPRQAVVTDPKEAEAELLQHSPTGEEALRA